MKKVFKKINKEEHPLCVKWLVSFEECVRSKNYEIGKSLFNNDLVCYGTVVEAAYSLADVVDSQWIKVWEVTEGFTFQMEDTHILGEDESDVVVISARWSSFSIEQGKKLRQGRCTITLVKDGQNEIGLVALHTHFSINPDGKIN